MSPSNAPQTAPPDSSQSESAPDWDARVRDTLAREDPSAPDKIQTLLDLGAERLGVDSAHLACIDPADGSYRVTEVAGPAPAVQQGAQADLSDTYCRMVVADGDPLSVRNAPDEDWADDPAYERSGRACYLGAKVVVGEDLYGTVSFTNPDARPEAFTDADRAFAALVAQAVGRTIERARQHGHLQEAQDHLQRTETLLKRVQAVADVGAWELDIHDRNVFWTEGACRVLGLSDRQTSGLDVLLGQIAPDRRSETRTRIVEAAEQEEAFTAEVPLTEEASPGRWIEIHGWPYVEEKLVTRLIGTVRDITDRRRRIRKLEEARHASVRRLARAAEHRHCETGRHIQRVGEMAALLAEALGAAETWQSRIEKAAPLHDVGKIGIADEILLKEGSLSAAEYEEMQRHTIIGADLLSGGKHPLIRMAERIARSHHERWDGTCYPDGLDGEDIPLSARIVAVADTVDAITHDRPYREARPVETAFDTLETEAGEQFDPAVCRAALERKPALSNLL